MNVLPVELIEYIGKFVIDIGTYKILNKEFYNVSKREHIKRICNINISKTLLTKQQIIYNNDVYNNPYQLLSSGIYKIFSTNSHNHLFILIDKFKSFSTEEDFFLYEPALLYINGILTPGKISFERFHNI